MRLTRFIVTALIVSLIPSMTPVRAQQAPCAPPVGSQSEVLRVTVGHFGESRLRSESYVVFWPDKTWRRYLSLLAASMIRGQRTM